MAIQGETAIGALGDPCALLTAAEVEAGTGYHVTGITRGTITTGDKGPSQNCVFLTDGPSLVGPLASALGAMSGQDPTAVSDAVNAAGGLVGVTLMPTDPDTSNAAPSDGSSDSPNPDVGVRMVPDLGASAAVISLPSGAAAVAAKDSTTLMLMVLIDDAIDPGGVEQMLRSAYGRI